MIFVRSPLRVSLGGGGTDLASYYSKHEGFLIAAAINKYVYVSAMRPFSSGIFLKYSQLERVERVEQVEHPIIREALNLYCPHQSQIEISTLADIPAGTGLGSSGSFTTALLKALSIHDNNQIGPAELAELACKVEIDLLNEPIGKQDQYAAAFGGLNSYTFRKDGNVEVRPLRVTQDTIYELEDNLLLFFTGFSRSASKILKDQEVRSADNDVRMIENLHYVKKLGEKSKIALERGDVGMFGELMDEHWENKKKRSGGMTNSHIDNWYEIAKKNGAIGGKVVGAGGGGFLMFVAADKARLRRAMVAAGLEEVRFSFDFEGTKVLIA